LVSHWDNGAERDVRKFDWSQRAAEATLNISGDIDISLDGKEDYASAALTKIREGVMVRVANN
jgi:hypothetical protein